MPTVPREIEDDFYRRRRSAIVPFVSNDCATVLSGPHAGRSASVVSIESLEPTRFLVEFGDDGSSTVLDAAVLRGLFELEELRSGNAFSTGDYGELDEGRGVWTANVSLERIREIVRESDLGYGTEFRLRIPGRDVFRALSTCGPVDATEPGRFIIYDGEMVVTQDASRQDVIAYFERLLA